MNDAAKRLRTLLQNCFDSSGQGQAALATFLGLSPSAISRMLSGSRQISAIELLGIKDFFSLSFSEIEKALDLEISNEADFRVIAHERHTQANINSNEYVAAYDEDKSGISVPGLFFQSVKLDRFDYLRWVRIFDDAMSPTINRGDIVVIDTSTLGGIGVYLIEITPEQLSVRRLDGRWEEGDLIVHVIPDNSKFRTFEAPLMSLKVVGQVVARFTTSI